MSSWRVPLRIARRDSLRFRGRSALVAAMIALPVLGVSALDVVARTDQLSPGQSATRVMGAADALVYDTPYAAIDQYGLPETAVPAVGPPARTERVDIPGLLPDGSRTLTSTAVSGLRLNAGNRTAVVTGRELAYDDPLAAGLYVPVEGRAPQTAQEAVLTVALADRLGVGVGDRVELDESPRPLAVVGLVQDGSSRDDRTLLVDDGALPPSGTTGAGAGTTEVLVDLPGAADISTVIALNRAGLWVELATPPPELEAGMAGESAGVGAVLALVLGMTLLEVVLLAGPAFAVGAKRQSHQLALLAAAVASGVTCSGRCSAVRWCSVPSVRWSVPSGASAWALWASLCWTGSAAR